MVGTGLCLWGMVVLLRRKSRWWWAPLVLAGALLLNTAVNYPGGDGETAAPAPVRSLQPTSVFGAPGYEFLRLEPAAEAQIRTEFTTGGAGFIDEAHIRAVTRQGEEAEIARLIVLAADVQAASDPVFFPSFASGFAESQGGAVSRDVAGVETRRVERGTGDLAGTTIVLWQHENLILIALGPDAADLDAFVEAVIGAAASGG